LKIRARRPPTPNALQRHRAKLGLAADYVLPAFEDTAHWLQKEAALPANVDPSDSKLADPEDGREWRGCSIRV